MRALSIRSLRKTFLIGPAHCARRAVALSNVDLEVTRGEILGVVGGNGAGKSTFLLCIAGIVRRDSGRVSWFGESFTGVGSLPGLAYVPCVPTYYPFLTVRDVLEHYSCPSRTSAGTGCKAIDAVCAQLGLHEKMTTPVAKLSLGEIKCLGIAQAMVECARVILLDATLDGLGDRALVVSRTLKEVTHRGTTIVAASRDAGALAPLADRIVVMDAGRIVGAFSADAPHSEGEFAPIEGELLHIAERMH